MSLTITPAGKAESKPGFRTDLQGLRALAVLLVMVYHIWFSRVSGGVDIFLMLSAFFLTASVSKRISRGERPRVLEPMGPPGFPGSGRRPPWWCSRW